MSSEGVRSGFKYRVRTTRLAARSAPARAALAGVLPRIRPQPTRERAAAVIIRRMPANRPAPLVRREPLDGAYVLLTFRHPEVAHEARAGQFVMIKAGDRRSRHCDGRSRS